MLDATNKDTKWGHAKGKEHECFKEYQVFEDLGKGTKPPPGYKPLKILTVYDVKHDG